MTTAKVDFSSVGWRSVEWTNLVTLYLRAYESRSPRPILGDRAAAEAVDRINYDFTRIHRAAQPWGNQFMVALRAKKLDVWSADFVRRRPDAVVLHLGCGLDTRAFRINPPPTVRWFDLDQPGVIELRRKLYDETDAYRMIGSSVTDPGWLDAIPTDRPTLVVAEGLLMYLDRTRSAGAAWPTDRPFRQWRTSLRHAVALRPEAVEDLHQRNRQVGNPRRPRNRGMEPRAPIRRASLRTGGLRVDSRYATAPGLPADVRDADAKLRRSEPVRVLGRASCAF